MAIKEKLFGTTSDGIKVYEHMLTNVNGFKLLVIDYGCIIRELWVPDKNNNLRDIVLGYDNLKDYEVDNAYFGACIGRHANRLENGILRINNIVYLLKKNSGNNNLHGGEKGFDRHVWKVHTREENSITYYRKSLDGEEGYPGNLDVYITYELTDDNELIIKYYAKGDKDTIVNLTNHSYFNLDGVNEKQTDISINNHKLEVYGDRITEVDNECNQTGRIINVKNTPYDFTCLKNIGDALKINKKQLENYLGYDINYVINGEKYKKAAYLISEDSGICMTCYTNQDAMQLYTSNYLRKKVGKNNNIYNKYAAICLETQGYPNSIKNKKFPSLILKRGEKYEKITTYKFGII